MSIYPNDDSKYNIDIVMCIDTTGDMVPFVNNFKEKAHTINERFREEFDELGAEIGDLRVKVIAFKDCTYDADPICESKFFTLNDKDEQEEFNCFVEKIEASYGGDPRESSLDALLLAMKTDWTTENARRKRHIIILVTDAEPKPLIEKFNEDLGESVAVIRDEWEKMDRRAKRLVLFAPDTDPWIDMSMWGGGIIHFPIEQYGGGCDIDLDEMLRLIVNSI